MCVNMKISIPMAFKFLHCVLTEEWLLEFWGNMTRLDLHFDKISLIILGWNDAGDTSWNKKAWRRFPCQFRWQKKLTWTIHAEKKQRLTENERDLEKNTNNVCYEFYTQLNTNSNAHLLEFCPGVPRRRLYSVMWTRRESFMNGNKECCFDLNHVTSQGQSGGTDW